GRVPSLARRERAGIQGAPRRPEIRQSHHTPTTSAVNGGFRKEDFMEWNHCAASSKAPRILLVVLASLALLPSCATTPKVPLTPVDTNGVAHVTVTFTGGVINVSQNPVVGCYVGSCTPKTTQIRWDIATGEELKININESYDDKPCQTYPSIKYRKNPHFRAIMCNGSHCQTVGPPFEKGCFKYDVTVKPSGGSPVTKDPDMIIM